MIKPVVAIDGPSGAGKSTVARMLADKLQYTHLDTGAMYRTVAYAAKCAGIDFGDAPALDKLCAEINIGLMSDGGELKVLLNEDDVTVHIRTPEMSLGSSAVSAVPDVREHMVRLQREIGIAGGIVAEGRDMGTVVFPDTKAKFYLDASVDERAKRRWLELKEKSEDISLETVRREIEERDRNDSLREHSPLKKADDAIYLDSTRISPEEIVRIMARHVKRLETADG